MPPPRRREAAAAGVRELGEGHAPVDVRRGTPDEPVALERVEQARDPALGQQQLGRQVDAAQARVRGVGEGEQDLVLAQAQAVLLAQRGVEFRARHAGVARVRGVFEVFDGSLDIDPGGAIRARGSIDAASLSTRLGPRDQHLRSSDFLDVANYPRIEFASTEVRLGPGGAVTMRGMLTIRGVTREIALEGELHGPGRDDEGTERIGIALEGRLDRRDYGLTWNAAVEGGGVLVGNRVDLSLEFSAVR